jgi:hypothetical protein
MLWNFDRADVRSALILLQREPVSQLVLIQVGGGFDHRL